MFSTLALVVAVLHEGGVVTVDLPSGREVGRWELPGEPAGVFVGPDGVLWVPLASADATLAIPPGKEALRLSGRLAPLFFREPDRLYAVFPGELAALSYPERVRIASWPLPVGLDVRFGACSDDGRVVALLDGSPPAKVLLVFPFDQGQTFTVPVTGVPDASNLAISQSFLAVGGGSRVGLWPVGAAEGVSVELPGNVVDMGWSPEGRELFVLVATPHSEMWKVPVPKKPTRPPTPKAVWRERGEPRALRVSDAGFVVLETDRVRLMSFRGRILGEFPVQEGRALGLLPSRLTSGSIPWSDKQP